MLNGVLIVFSKGSSQIAYDWGWIMYQFVSTLKQLTNFSILES